MILFQFETTLVRRACDKHVRSPSWARSLNCIRYAMTPHAPHQQAAASRAGRLRATWSRNAVTGALECRWDVEPSDDGPRRTVRSRRTNGVRMSRRSLYADMRPPPR
jgi:hypothetical protein